MTVKCHFLQLLLCLVDVCRLDLQCGRNEIRLAYGWNAAGSLRQAFVLVLQNMYSSHILLGKRCFF